MGLGWHVATTAKTTVQSEGDEGYVCTMTGRRIRRRGKIRNWSTVSELGAHRTLPLTTAIWRASVVAKGQTASSGIKRREKEYGVELTAVYLDDRSVMDDHRMVKSEAKSWFLHEWAQIQDYLHCIARRVEEKVSKAQGYDNQRDLILAVYLNERILSQYFTRELEDFIRQHHAFRRIDPFVRIVFSLSSMGDGVVYP